MAITTRVVPTEKGTVVEAKERLAPLWVQMLFALSLASAVPLLIALVAGTDWFIQSPVGALVYQSTLYLGPLSFRFYYLFVCLIALTGIGIGLIAGDAFFVRPITALLMWTKNVNSSKLEHVPVLPAGSTDEVRELGREVGRLTARVLQIAERDKDLVGEKSLFLTIVAHQLRTPLTELTWSINALLAPSGSEQARAELLGKLNTMLKRLQLVVNHLLASAGVEEGRFGYVIERVDITTVIQKLIEEFGPIAEDKHLSLTFAPKDVIPSVFADSERISLALFDLISNAIDYTPSGGTVTVSLTPEKDRVEVSVADTGIGIPEKELPFLFNKFYRGDAARHLRPDGSGLGLFLVKNIVSSHGSEIRVESNSTLGGSRFSFDLNTTKPR